MESGSQIMWRDRSSSDDFAMLQGMRDNDFFSIRNPPNDSIRRVNIYPYQGERVQYECSSLEEAQTFCEESG